MKTKTTTTKSSPAKEVSFELKYCERCGGLWLRPAGGGQIYCKACGREMAEMPPASTERSTPQLPGGPQWGDDAGYSEDSDGMDFEAGGVA
jgi:hypothetical protein